MRDVLLLGYLCGYRAKLVIDGDERNPEVLRWENRHFYARDDSRESYLEFDLPESTSLVSLLVSGRVDSVGDLAPGMGGVGLVGSGDESPRGSIHPTPRFLLPGPVHPPTKNS
jgi:hypothetical protein